MKKTLIALAAFAAVSSFAQSSVTIYGVLDQGYNTNEFSAAGASVKVTGIQSILSGNRVGFKGTEDLGGGLKANFQYEFGAVLDGAATAGALNSNRNSFVEVAGPFGSVNAGNVYTLIHNVQGTFDPSGNATAAGFIGGITNRARQANALTYTTPDMNGFTAQVQLGYGETADYTGTTTANKSDSQAFAAKYAAGPVVVMIAHEKVTFGALSVLVPSVSLATVPAAAAVTDSLADQTATSFGGSYDFGVVKAMYLNTTAKAGSAASSAEIKTQTLGVSAPIGAFTLNASVGKGDGTDQAANTVDLKGYQIGANYAFSKRTTAYTIVGKTSYEVPASTLDNKTFAVGVRHTF